MESSTSLNCLVYKSKTTSHLSPLKLEDITASACERNSELNVTGVLLSDGDYFIQYLEGPQSALDTVLQIIRNSTSHLDLTILVNQPITHREFPKWFMGLIQPTQSEMLNIMNWEWWDNINDHPWGDHSNLGVQALKEFCADHNAEEVGSQEF
ncbi:MAG: BLUF domain-containing protein [Limnobacter sp.]|nr:BLUF domain-containing protein [Limnobacter sp.]